MVNLDILDDNESRHVVEAPVSCQAKYEIYNTQGPGTIVGGEEARDA